MTKLIALDPVESRLTPARIDERLAAGWFPFGQRWMTCRAWPTETGPPHDCVWIRVRTASRRASDRQRRFARDGFVAAWNAQPRFDDEHQALYDRFRQAKHPDWEIHEASALLHEGAATSLLAHTREIAIRDRAGRLVAFRWFVEGATAIAGIAAVFDPDHDGLGTVVRRLADQWAHGAGLTHSYPGYVRPGADDPWHYKVKPGRTEWLDLNTASWRDWDAGPPRAEELVLAEMRRRLEARGAVTLYPSWANPVFDPTSRGLTSPYYVAGPRDGENLTIIVWDLERRDYDELRVVVTNRL